LLSAKCNVFVIVVADIRNTYKFVVRRLKHTRPLGRQTVDGRKVCKMELIEMFWDGRIGLFLLSRWFQTS